MDLFQDQSVITIVVAVLAVVAGWWTVRRVVRLAVRLSRIGCLAVLALALLAVVTGWLR